MRSATEKLICALIPSYANDRINGEPLSSSVQARGRSSTREPVTTLAVCTGAGVGVSSNVWLRESDLHAHRRSTTQALIHDRALHVSGSSHGCPVRRHAHRLPSLRRARIFSYQRRPFAVTCNRQPALIDERRWSMPCLCHVFSPIWPGISGRRDSPAGIRQPLRKTPM